MSLKDFKMLVSHFQDNLLYIWQLLAIAIILLVKISFICFESGSVSTKTTHSVLNKSTFVFVVSFITYYCIGFGFANEACGGLLGTQFMFGRSLDQAQILTMLWQYTFLYITIAILTSCIIERTHLDTYIMLTVYVSAIVYPIPVSWVWGGGWLAQMGVLDYAGAGVCHVLAGVIGLISTMIVGPRLGVFQGKLNLEQMGALYMQHGENLNLDSQHIKLIQSKHDVFANGYKQPNFANIKF